MSCDCNIDEILECCIWKEDIDNHDGGWVYETGCGLKGIGLDFSIDRMGYKFCPYCGGNIKELK